MDMQKFIDTINEASRLTRADYHLTLGAAIKQLEELPSEAVVSFDWNGQSPDHPHSYRGYYSDLSFESGDDSITASEFLDICTKAHGSTFEGYKGGDYTMVDDTPLWAAGYGCCGRAIMGLSLQDGAITIRTKKDTP